MNIKENLNPLSEPQREKAGAETYEDYAYQYHWALYRVLSEHEKCNEYAVFVELHEDVVIADSLNVEKANFEFNQIKTINKKLSTSSLISLKNGKSIIGKLIESSLNKGYSDKISTLNLVSVKAFNLELKTEGLRLEKITISDLSTDQYNLLEEAIKKELSSTPLPSNLQFIIPELSEKKFQNEIIAVISKLITSLFPGSNYNSVDIYRILIDEINHKGMVTYDFKKWDELLTKKALTSTTVTKVINAYTNIKDEAKIDYEFNNICSEIGLNSIQGKKLKRTFNRYRISRISNSSTIQIDTTRKIIELIENNISNGLENLDELIINVINTVPIKMKKQFNLEDDLKGAIICEYIMMN